MHLKDQEIIYRVGSEKVYSYMCIQNKSKSNIKIKMTWIQINLQDSHIMVKQTLRRDKYTGWWKSSFFVRMYFILLKNCNLSQRKIREKHLPHASFIVSIYHLLEYSFRKLCNLWTGISSSHGCKEVTSGEKITDFKKTWIVATHTHRIFLLFLT